MLSQNNKYSEDISPIWKTPDLHFYFNTSAFY
nr:MAG TPA: hypothetical protein [Caudoviricetes sp.]